MAKVLGLKQLLQRTYDFLENLPPEIIHSFGKLTSNFIMIIWGDSANGKSNLMMQLLAILMKYGNVLYVGLEEGFEATMQLNALRSLNEESHSGKILFADHEMSYEELIKRLKRKKSPRFIVIDSIQYWNITYVQYKALKEMFPKKTFIFLSHSKGKIPDGKTADKIRYDAGIKVHVDGFVAFVKSRYGGNNPYVIWEEGAKKHWGKKYKKIIIPIPKTKTDEPIHNTSRSMESKVETHSREDSGVVESKVESHTTEAAHT